MADLNMQLEDLRRQKYKWDKPEQALNNEISLVGWERDDVKKQLEDLQEQHRKCDKKSDQLEQKVQDLHRRLADILAENSKVKTSSQQEIENLRKQYDICATGASKKSEEVQRLESIFSEEKQRMEDEIQVLQDLRDQHSKKARQQYNDLQEQIESLKYNHSEEKEVWKLEEASHNQMIETIENLKRELQSQKQEIESLTQAQQPRKSPRDNQALCQQNVNHWVEEKIALENSIQDLREQRDECVKELANSQRFLREQVQQNARAARATEQKIEELEEQQLKRFGNQLNTVNKAFLNSQAELQEALDQLKKLQQLEKQHTVDLAAAEKRHRICQLDLREIQLIFKEQFQKSQQKEHEIKSLIQQLDNQQSMTDTFAGRVFDLVHETEAQKYEIGDLKRAQAQGTSLEAQLQSKIDRDTKKIRELCKTIGAQEERIRRVQQYFFKNQKPPPFETIEEKMLEDCIRKEVVQTTTDWSWDYVAEDVDLSNLKHASPELWKMVQQISQEATPGQSREYSPQILLNAMLAHYIAETVIKHPFLQLTDGEEVTFCQKMEDLYEDFLEIDEVEAHAWRRQTLRFILRAQASDRPHFWESNMAWMDEQVKNFQPEFGSKLASDFISGPAQAIIAPRSSRSQRQQGLGKVIQAAGWFGSALWRQSEALKIQRFEDLRGKKFSSKSKEMEWIELMDLTQVRMRWTVMKL